MGNTTKSILAGALISGLLAGASVFAEEHAAQGADQNMAAGKNGCNGKADKNSCKGNSKMKAKKDKNSCKGKEGCGQKKE